jgi:acyl-CoA synthetase (AMP-forming)/AMP-acid ligase II
MRRITSKASSGTAEWQLDAAMAVDISLDTLFRRAFRVFADRTAVTWEGGQRSYREVGERAWRLANAVRAKGYCRGDTIAILSETRPEYVECYAAMAALGVTVATLNIRLRPDEIAVCLRKTRPRAVVASGTLTGATRRPTVRVFRCPPLDRIRADARFRPLRGDSCRKQRERAASNRRRR